MEELTDFFDNKIEVGNRVLIPKTSKRSTPTFQTGAVVEISKVKRESMIGILTDYYRDHGKDTIVWKHHKEIICQSSFNIEI